MTRVIINQALARQLFGEENPVGREIRILPRKGAGAPREIIGVAGAIKHRGLQGAEVPILYWHSQEAPAFIVRTSQNPAALVTAIRAILRKVDPELVVSRAFTTEQIVARSLADRRFATLLMLAFDGLGTLLAALGLYGVTAYAVSRRKREIGLRVALGAQREDVLRLILGQGMRLVGVGIAAGLVSALILARAMQSLLFVVTPADPRILTVVSVLLAAIALLACYVPARRATRMNPTDVLRAD